MLRAIEGPFGKTAAGWEEVYFDAQVRDRVQRGVAAVSGMQRYVTRSASTRRRRHPRRS